MTGTRNTQPAEWNRILRWAAALFAAAVAVHAVDHLRRGMDFLPPAVEVAGMTQILLAAITVGLVFIGNRWAPHAAVAIGFISALGFAATHLLPHWGFLSDSFINAPPMAHVTWFSLVTALLEIAADVFFGLAGVAVLRSRRSTAIPSAAGRPG